MAFSFLWIGHANDGVAKTAANVSGLPRTTANPPDTQLKQPGVTGDYLIPGGHILGVKLFSTGVLVIGLTHVTTANGDTRPAQEAGLQVGDIITHIDAKAVNTTQALEEALTQSKGEPLAFRIQRGPKNMVMQIMPEATANGQYKLGAWVRDSMAGIGTLTYVDPNTNRFGALGHGINDVDTGKLMPLSSGMVMSASVDEVRKGEAGKPGEIKGIFDMSRDAGYLQNNSDSGIFGQLNDTDLTGGAEAVPILEAKDVKVGPAIIRSNVSGDTVQEFAVEIVRIYTSDTGQMRDFMLRVTDPALLNTTGGIIQGMSGSPVLQDGKLVGAVTHVLIGDPKRGYGIFIRHMLSADTVATAA